MILNNKDINILNLMMQIMEIRNRFAQFGIAPATEFNPKTGVGQPLFYDQETLDDDGMYTVLKHLGGDNRYYTEFFVRYRAFENKADDFLEIAVPVVFEDDCKMCDDADCEDCSNIGYYQLYLIARDGSITEDIDMDEENDEHECCGCCDCCDCCPEEFRDTGIDAAAMMRCRESGAHDYCNCECGEEHCFVECGPNPDEECPLNENGRCHCKYNRCCGCDCECDPDEED